MIELLNSDYPPIGKRERTFEKAFSDLLNDTKKLKIATGYISEDSVATLLGLYRSGFDATLDLLVGMHYFEGFSKPQFMVLSELAMLLREKNLGNVYLANSVKYHGKVYSFMQTNGKLYSIVGSSNLTKITPVERIYDTDVFIDDENFNKEIISFFDILKDKNASDLNSFKEQDLKFLKNKPLFENYLSVENVGKEAAAQIQVHKTSTYFDIPLKTEEKSNLNCFFGKGRTNFSNGSTLPRPWYEVELIVSKSITSQQSYPVRDYVFNVITDDGYKFKCKTSGDFSKNFRSADDLKILGRWIKGRMENEGVLKIGEKVTEDTLKKYRRDSIRLTKTDIPDLWYLDFGV